MADQAKSQAGSGSANVFGKYASAYDAIYRQKNYEAECDFLETVFRAHSGIEVRSILDLGCGTGGHSTRMARRGYRVTGLDRSPEMIAIAEEKATGEGLDNPPDFRVADIQNYDLCEEFDAVVCMFAVLGYQTSNEELFRTLVNARRHVKPGGLFICDVWHGPAVVSERPSVRVSSFEDGGDRIIRIAEPHLDMIANVTTVSYRLLRVRGDRLLDEIQEDHRMRYFFRPEITFFLDRAGFETVLFTPFGEMDGEVDETTWNVSIAARAV